MQEAATEGRVPVRTLRIEPEKCTGCLRCEIACSYQQTGEFRPSSSVIRVSSFESHTSYAPYTCFQCTEAWCVRACPIGAIDVSAVGARVVASDRCVGCKLCTVACPYGTIFYDAETHKAVKCDLCGGDPACAEACPTGAITWVEASTSDSLGSFAAIRAAPELAAVLRR